MLQLKIANNINFTKSFLDYLLIPDFYWFYLLIAAISRILYSLKYVVIIQLKKNKLPLKLQFKTVSSRTSFPFLHGMGRFLVLLLTERKSNQFFQEILYSIFESSFKIH